MSPAPLTPMVNLVRVRVRTRFMVGLGVGSFLSVFSSFMLFSVVFGIYINHWLHKFCVFTAFE